MRKRDILSVYCSGLLELALGALGCAVLGLIALQVIARLTGSGIDAEAALLQCWQAVMLMALWPGQRFWTIRRRTGSGFEHSVIGVPSDDDMRRQNHRVARNICNRG